MLYINIFSQEKITIFANQTLSSETKLMQGFIHGGSEYLDSVKVAKLKPAFWRIGAYFLAGSGYQNTKRFNPKITVNINDLYMIVNQIPSQNLSKPWIGNWVDWDNLVTIIANNSVTNNEQIDYWDVWGEPDNYWTGTYGQWIEMYRRTDSILTDIIPNAKIIGPEFGFGRCNFNVNSILQFLDRLYAAGSSVSGVSWHEFCNPHDVPSHVKQVRDSLAVRPWIGNLDILIPEYAGPTNHTVPGWNVGWLYYFEKSKVEWVSHGCWNETDGNKFWSNCEVGLNGLFMYDNLTPQPNYWVHRAYAELNNMRIQTSSSHLKTVALASKENITQEIKIMVGRYDNPNLGWHNDCANVEIKINNYPYCSSCTMPIAIQRIPSTNVPYAIPLNSPVTVLFSAVSFTGDSTSIFINDFVDGDVYIIYVNPSDTSLVSNTDYFEYEHRPMFHIFPNPSTETLTIRFFDNQSTKGQIQIFNSMGILLKEFSVHQTLQTSQIDISDLPNGLYFVGIKDKPKFIKKIIKCAP